jgi:spore photoproduct lyase
MSSSPSSVEPRGGNPDPGVRALFWTPEAEGLPALARARARLPGLPGGAIASPEELPAEYRNNSCILVTGARGEAIHPCRCRRDYLCCGYLSVDLYEGCSMGCSYCALRAYLDFGPVVVRADPAPSIARLREIALGRPGLLVRAGSGELGDSLLYDGLFELSRDFIEGLSDLPSLRFEMKTKSSHVAQLLDIRRKGGAVVAFSVNAPSVCAGEEGCAAPLAERLAAAREVLDAGYGLAFHLDPVFLGPWRRGEYREFLELLSPFRGRLAWMSLGALRYAPSLRDSGVEPRPWFGDEMPPGPDGKLRYLQRQRIAIFRDLMPALRDALGVPVYLCMEYRPVWDAVAGGPPAGLPALSAFFRDDMASASQD